MESVVEGQSFLVYALYFLTAAVIAVPLFKKLGLGSILGYLCAGVVLGPQLLGLIDDPIAVLHVAEYGVILLLFIIGLELAPDRLWDMRANIAIIGGSQLVLTAAVLAVVFWLLALSSSQALILGLTLALSSTAFAIQLMSEARILATPLGRKGFAILLLQDLAVIPILILVDVMAFSGSNTATGMPWYVGVFSIVLLLLFNRFGLNQLLRLVAQTNNREIMTAASLLIVIGVATLMDAVGLSMGLGAFIAGIMLANSNYRHQLESDIEPFKGILLGLFFIAVGMTLNLSLLLGSPVLIIGGAIALVVLKAGVIVGVLRLGKVPLKDGMQLGLVLSQGGEFAFVIMSQAAQVNLFSAALTDQVTLIVGLSMALTSPIVMLHRRLSGRRSQNQPAHDSHWDTHEPEVIIAGFGRFGQIIGRMLQARHVPFTAMDKDPVHVEFVRQFGNKLYFGDLSRLDLLKAAGIVSAKILVVAVNNIEESLHMVTMAREQNPKIKIVARAIDREHAYRLHKLGADSVIRETFASGIEAASDTLKNLGFTESQALETAIMFRKHDEALLLKSVDHMDNVNELQMLTKQGRLELEQLFEADSKNPV